MVSGSPQNQKEKYNCFDRTMGIVDIYKLALRTRMIASGFGVTLATT